MPITPNSTPSKRRKRQWHPTTIALAMFALLLLVGGGTLSLVSYFYYTNIHQPLGGFVRPVARGQDEPVLNAKPLQGQAWNILLLGSDNDNKYTFPAVLTQVMMVVHVDTSANKVELISIPRDSWVFIPEVGGMHKIDQAFFLGATHNNNSFENGVRLARLTVEKDYGIAIDRYAWVGLSGFAKVIDTLGGVDVDVTHPITDDQYPNDTGKGSDPHNPFAFKRLSFAPGPQHLSGEQALEYVRTRHADLVGDIGRTQRQQQVLQALRQKLNATSILSHFTELLKDLTGQVYTDLSEDEMLSFANFGRTLAGDAFQRVTLGPGSGDHNFGEYKSIYDPSLGSNQDVVIPHCTVIQPMFDQIFGFGGTQGCNVTGEGLVFSFSAFFDVR